MSVPVLWCRRGEGPAQVSERRCGVGAALCAAACPDAPLSVAVGGDSKQCCIQLLDLNTNEQGKLSLPILHCFKTLLKLKRF